MILKKKIITDFAIYYLRKDFCLFVMYGANGDIQVTYEELPVTGHGITLDEAIQDFCDAFDVQYQGLVHENKNNLTGQALNARKLFLELVDSVYLINDRKHIQNEFRPDEEITKKIPRSTVKKVRRTKKK